MSMFSRLASTALRRFRHSTSGNVMMMFAISLVPMMMLIGAGVDYSNAVKVRTKLNAIADGAALSAVTRMAVATLPSQSSAIEAGARSFFQNEAQLVGGVTLNNVTATVARTLTSLTVTVAYTARVPNSFGSFLDADGTAIAGSATSSSALPTYIDFYLMLDNSPSMGLGATVADIDALVAATKNNASDASCAFACHDLSKPGADYYTLAKTLGITMRIDVVRQATQQLMDYATNTRLFSDQFRVAIYTFGRSLTQIVNLTDKLDVAKTAASVIDLQTVPYQNHDQDRYTNLDALVPQMGTAIPTPGDGSSSLSPQAFMFLVTDGVADEPTPGNPGGRTIAPITVSQCTAIKARGIQIAVLYTTYFPLPTNSFYNGHVAPWANTIGPRLQSCASPGFYFEVSPSEGIAAAMQAMFQKAVMQARLTQ